MTSGPWLDQLDPYDGWHGSLGWDISKDQTSSPRWAGHDHRHPHADPRRRRGEGAAVSGDDPSNRAMSLPVCPSAFIRFAVVRCPVLLMRWMVAGVGDTTNHAESGTPRRDTGTRWRGTPHGYDL